jgi:hypothetical protein
VIRRDEALMLLRDACPSFRGFEVPQYPDDQHGFADMAELSALARHLVDLAERGDAEEFPAVFAVVDRLLGDGDDDTVAYVRTHLLEDVQNITSHRDVCVSPDAFRAVLGPLGLDAWDELDEAWQAAIRHADMDAGGRARPRATDYLDAHHLRREVQSMTREMSDGTLASPADVLRYEAAQHDEQLDSRNFHLRVVPIALVLVALLLIVFDHWIGG